MGLTDRPGLLRAQLDDGVALLTMDDPTDHNALSHAMVNALGDAFSAIARADDIGAVVLAGSSEMFSSGASRGVIDDLTSGRRDSSELLLPRLLLDCPVPCLAAMAGHAVGGGLALGLAADFVLLGLESRYCLNFVDLGFTPGMGTTRLLEHVLSPAIAHELLFSGEARLGRDFVGKSGINYILPRAEVMPKALDLAARIAEKPRAVLTALKRTLSIRRREAFESARTLETLMHTISFARWNQQARKQES
ncbi:MAG: Enoyl-CoA hydratase/isomerase [Myxococcales bacterium]|nr:Enoyl-CoA hydratase/isomerase [Myxococcales bacterium]